MNKQLVLGANALIIKSELQNENNLHKQKIFTVSPSKLMGYIRLNKNNFSFRIQNQQILDIKDNENNKIKGFNLLDVMVGYQTTIGKFSLGIQNMLNTNYQTIWSVRAQTLYGKKASNIFYYKGRGKTLNISYNLDF